MTETRTSEHYVCPGCGVVSVVEGEVEPGFTPTCVRLDGPPCGEDLVREEDAT